MLDVLGLFLVRETGTGSRFADLLQAHRTRQVYLSMY